MSRFQCEEGDFGGARPEHERTPEPTTDEQTSSTKDVSNSLVKPSSVFTCYLLLFSMEEKMAKRRSKLEGLKEQQEELRRQKRQNSDAQRQKLEAQLVRHVCK